LFKSSACITRSFSSYSVLVQLSAGLQHAQLLAQSFHLEVQVERVVDRKGFAPDALFGFGFGPLLLGLVALESSSLASALELLDGRVVELELLLAMLHALRGDAVKKASHVFHWDDERSRRRQLLRPAQGSHAVSRLRRLRWLGLIGREPFVVEVLA